VQAWLEEKQVDPTFIPPGQPWKNGFIESFHDKFRDECLQREWFQSLLEAKVVIENCDCIIIPSVRTARWTIKPRRLSPQGILFYLLRLSFHLGIKTEAGQRPLPRLDSKFAQ
jgi:transposase InsO family protein